MSEGIAVSQDRQRFQAGKGSWAAFDRSIDEVCRAVEDWKDALAGIDKPWLCWNVDPDWCLLQQRLVLEVGWVPVVGSDPRAPKTELAEGAIAVDFNARLQFPAMYPHFPLEFVFLYADRLAFWHSDLLCRDEKMRSLADIFEGLPDGQMAAVPDYGGRRNIFRRKSHRYWELIGCTTRGASESQFMNGCGWWMEFYHHPNSPPSIKGSHSGYYWDYGVGVMHWKRRHGGRVVPIRESYVAEGHFSRINNPSYVHESPRHRRDLSKELSRNFHLAACARELGIERFCSS